MPPGIDFIYDLASPNAYLADRAIRGIEERTDVKFNYIPCLLGGIFKTTGNQAPFMTFANVKGKMQYERVEMDRFVRKHGLTRFQLNPHFPVNSLLLMRGAAAAEIDGTHQEYIRAGMVAMWEQGLKMDDPEVFTKAMSAAGLDGAHLLARAHEPDAKQRLIDNTSAAVKRGVFGIPTFFVGDEMFFGKERLEQVEEAIRHSAERA
ncbi:2-hydroxychromene-2-carboxylate isomerase [Roseovarius sp. CAU 1744]|uniref:2-hydroxychromene-2-carboxylate isomerase n=1 Tax=Roseovarius sp. CAU 1744 TaxID=3140368 RepID=UPI00325C08B1